MGNCCPCRAAGKGTVKPSFLPHVNSTTQKGRHVQTPENLDQADVIQEIREQKLRNSWCNEYESDPFDKLRGERPCFYYPCRAKLPEEGGSSEKQEGLVSHTGPGRLSFVKPIEIDCNSPELSDILQGECPAPIYLPPPRVYDLCRAKLPEEPIGIESYIESSDISQVDLPEPVHHPPLPPPPPDHLDN